MNSTNIRIAVGVGALCLCSAAAAQLHWINPNGGNFSDPANWSPAKSPGPGDTVIFDLAAAYTVTVDGEFDIRPGSAEFSAGDVTLVSQGGLGWDQKLVVSGFKVLGVLGTEPAATLDSLYVQVGKLTVDRASLSVLNSKVFDTSISNYGPGWSVTDGTLLVSGPNAWVCNCAFAAPISLLGESLAIVSDGATLSVGDAKLYSDPDSVLIVEGSGSKASAFGCSLKGLTIARDGATLYFDKAWSTLGEVHVESGATLDTPQPSIDWLEVSGGGKATMSSWWYQGAGVVRGPGSLIEGGSGGIDADVTVEDGAVVHSPYLSGHTRVVGSGRLEHPGHIDAVNLLELIDGGLVKTPVLKVRWEQNFGPSVAGKLMGTGTVDGDLLVDTWKGVAIGDPIGRIEVTGDVAIFGPTTAFDIQGPRPGIDHDVLTAGGEVYLHTGGISVELPGGFTPVLGDSFQVIESPSFKPPIYYFSAPPLPGGLELRPDVNPQGLAVRTVCFADCDEDGALTIDDFLCFQTRFALDDLRADCQLNGWLNIDDFLCFQQKFALGCEFP